MFCPVCRSEYREGFTHCSDCNVDLVASLPPQADEATETDLALAWRGSDPSAFSAALAALKEAGIPSFEISDHDQLAWGLGVPRPRYEILVHESDLPSALDLVAPFQERAGLAVARDIWKSKPQTGEAELEDTEPTSEEEAPTPGRQAPDDIAEPIRAASATAQVWSGDDPEMTQILRDCLRENGIGCVVSEAASGIRIFVLPKDEMRAREIIREVIEATPPA